MPDDPMRVMWSEACEMLMRADRMHRQFFQLARSAARGPTWEPPIDVFETDDALHILVALPGVAPQDVEVLLDAGSLTIAAERPIPAGSRAALIHRLEIPYGRLERHIELPLASMQLGRRELIDGCLLLTLHKL